MINSLRLKATSLFIISGILMVTMGVVIAADEHVTTVKYRTTVMSSLSSHIRSIYTIIQGADEYTDHIKFHAAAMHSMSKLLPNMFPFGSGAGETRAMSTIWDEDEKFAGAVKKFEATTFRLLEASKSSDITTISTAMEAVGAACGECHRSYRKPN